MKKDITTIEDVQNLVNEFYTKVRKDKVIGPIFNEVAVFDWEIHIPVMYQFWETMLLDKLSYQGNPMTKHLELSEKTNMGEVQFDTWLLLWENTIDALFDGPTARLAKDKAQSIAKLMLYKINQEGRPFQISG